MVAMREPGSREHVQTQLHHSVNVLEYGGQNGLLVFHHIELQSLWIRKPTSIRTLCLLNLCDSVVGNRFNVDVFFVKVRVIHAASDDQDRVGQLDVELLSAFPQDTLIRIFTRMHSPAKERPLVWCRWRILVSQLKQDLLFLVHKDDD